jgi:hypothetical protein
MVENAERIMARDKGSPLENCYKRLWERLQQETKDWITAMDKGKEGGKMRNTRN